MIQITLETKNTKTEVEFSPSADFITCLIPALLGALPCFIQSFMSCLSGSPAVGVYNPGDRPRCA